jgi:hypothetical protein
VGANLVEAEAVMGEVSAQDRRVILVGVEIGVVDLLAETRI